MPGIYGIIDLSREGSERRQRELRDIAVRMGAAMSYEPFYASEMVSCPAAGAWIGRVYIAEQPGASERASTAGVVALTAGVDDGDSAAARLAALYGELGEHCAAALDGIHSGVIADSSARRCVIFNDRYGRERLFVHADRTMVLFSSEAKAILAVAPSTRAFDTTGLAEFLACGCTLGSHSMFRNIEVLGAASVLIVEGGSLRRQSYFDRSSLEQLAPASEREFLDGFPEALRSAVNRYVDNGPKVAVSLTGGLDSRMVMAVLDAPSGRVPTYTFGSMFRTTGDVSVAREVANRCGQLHRTIELGSSFLGGFEASLHHSVYVSDGSIGMSGASELYVNRMARSIAPARMTGNWGGELMRGVRAFKAITPRLGPLAPALTTAMGACAQALRDAPHHPVSAALFQQAPMQGFARNAIERSQLVMRHPFLSDDVVRWLYRAPGSLRASDAGALHVIGRRPALLTIPTDRGELGRRSKAREAGRRFMIKAEYMTSHGAPDWIAHLSSRLPSWLLERRFLGTDKFQHFRFWSRRRLAPFVRESLTGRNLGELDQWIDRSHVTRIVEDHIAGRANYTDEIDKLLTLTIAQQTLFGQRAPQPQVAECLA